MTLDTAIHILCEMHTRDDERVGVLVYPTASYEFRRFSQSDVIKAWGVLREHDHRPTAPAKEAGK